MANMHKYTTVEALNAGVAADWQVQSAASVGSSASSVDVSGYHNIHIQTDNDIYFKFTTSSTDSLSTSNDLYIVGGDTIYSFQIPSGLGNTVYIQWERKSSDATVRYVLA